ncbi:unnamed protein product [Sympodiomycopsis kandeliae]
MARFAVFYILTCLSALALITSASQVPFVTYSNDPTSPGSITGNNIAQDEYAYGEPTIHIELPFDASAFGTSTSRLSPTELIAAQNGSFARLSHREFPHASVRIKRHASAKELGKDAAAASADPNAFCDPSVTSWSGYLDLIDGKSIFFWFFESRSNPDTDDVIMWTNGGPGASGSLFMLMEGGPCRALPGPRDGPPINGTVPFEQSWNSRANLLILEQPAGVGYSYVRFGQPTVDTNQAARDVYAFFRIFFGAFEQFRSNPFHIAGESYGGRYIPRFAAEMHDRDQELLSKAKKENKDPEPGSILDLQSIIVGNGVNELSSFYSSAYETICTNKAGNDGLPPLDIVRCQKMKRQTDYCRREIQKRCIETEQTEGCTMLNSQCEEWTRGVWEAQGGNAFDINHPCDPEAGPLCYSESQWIDEFLDRDDVRALIGAPPRSVTGKYSSYSAQVASGFVDAGDFNHASKEWYEQLLERGVKALIYAGAADLACGYLHNLYSIQKYDYPGKIDFAKHLRPWIVDGKEVGLTATGGNLTFVTVSGAPHMVPYKVEHAIPALAMLQRWFDGEKM